uniref:NTR domain-containing protein n=1 Tax=Meloidogyne enterolobii TaxID=390850 RepID=A0A6V7WHN6_MELEN|nr:unnamed protein product [Meloidogyne enterolobii]
MKIFILYFFVILTNFWGILFTNGCYCGRMSEEEKYCNSDWVAHVKSLRRGEVRDKEGKDNKTCNQNNKIDCIYSATNSAACGVELKDSQEYLLFGRYGDDGKRKISSCGYNREWNEVSEKLKKLLKDGDMDKYC